MVKGEGRIAFLTLAGLAFLARTHFGAGEENRAKDAKDAKVKGMKDDGNRYRDWPLPNLLLSRRPPAASVVAGLTELGGPRHPRRPPTWMVKGEAQRDERHKGTGTLASWAERRGGIPAPCAGRSGTGMSPLRKDQTIDLSLYTLPWRAWRAWRAWREPISGRGKRIAQRTPRTQRLKARRMRRLLGWWWRGRLLCESKCRGDKGRGRC